MVQFIPARSSSNGRFLNAIKAAAKRYVPRGFRDLYVPGWKQNCEDLYHEYNTNHETATANRLIEELNKQRKKEIGADESSSVCEQIL
jgi:hypothetical protein